MNKDDVLRIAKEVPVYPESEDEGDRWCLDFAARLEAEWMKDAEPVAEVGSVQGQTLYAFSLSSTIPFVGTKLYTRPAPTFPHCEACGSSAWFCTVCRPAPIPSTHVLVPKEPTKKMMDAPGPGYFDLRHIYKSMIAAAQGEK